MLKLSRNRPQSLERIKNINPKIYSSRDTINGGASQDDSPRTLQYTILHHFSSNTIHNQRLIANLVCKY
jgi:hypothetical protein